MGVLRSTDCLQCLRTCTWPRWPLLMWKSHGVTLSQALCGATLENNSGRGMDPNGALLGPRSHQNITDMSQLCCHESVYQHVEVSSSTTLIETRQHVAAQQLCVCAEVSWSVLLQMIQTIRNRRGSIAEVYCTGQNGVTSAANTAAHIVLFLTLQCTRATKVAPNSREPNPQHTDQSTRKASRSYPDQLHQQIVTNSPCTAPQTILSTMVPPVLSSSLQRVLWSLTTICFLAACMQFIPQVLYIYSRFDRYSQSCISTAESFTRPSLACCCSLQHCISGEAEKLENFTTFRVPVSPTSPFPF
jgi:hypothetical protein